MASIDDESLRSCAGSVAELFLNKSPWRIVGKWARIPTVMSGPFVSTRPAISRRKFLRGAGIVLSLPLLDAMTPAFAAVAKRVAADLTPGGKPRRFFGICNNLGLLPEHFFPKTAGRD